MTVLNVNTDDDDTERVEGIFTPIGQLLCYPCHGQALDRGRSIDDDEFEDACEPKDLERIREDDIVPDKHGDVGVGHCDDCGDEVWTTATLGVLDELRQRVDDLELHQSGGMVPAAELRGDEYASVGITAGLKVGATFAPDFETFDGYYGNADHVPDDFEPEYVRWDDVDEAVEALNRRAG